jgi:hypothetical protein
MEIDFTSQIRAAKKCECGDSCKEGCDCSCHQKKKALVQEELIAFSIEVVKIFEQKMEVHNEAHPRKKVSVDELKRMFMQGVRAENKNGLSLVELGLARVISFLKLKSGIFNANEHVFEYSMTPPRRSLNVSACWLPNQSDFNQAKEDVEKSGLDVSRAKSPDDFYMETAPDFVRRNWIVY